MTQPHVVVICGSLCDRSYTRLAPEHALTGVSVAGGTAEFVDLRRHDLLPLDADFDEQSGSAELVRVVDGADAVILGTSVYHGSYPGILKNALDYCGFNEFGEKTVSLPTVAGGSFPVTALEHLRSVCRSLDPRVLLHQVAIPRVPSLFDSDDLASEDLREWIERLSRDAVVYANIRPEPPTFEGGEGVGTDD